MNSSIKRSILALSLVALTSACTQERATSKAADPDAKADASSTETVEKLPDAAELLAAHVEAAGGAEAIAKFESIHAEGTVSVPGQELSGTMQVWWQKGGKFYLEQYVDGLGNSRAGYDGKTIWLDDPITGLRILEGAEAGSYLQGSLMFPGHDWPDHFKSAKTLPRAEGVPEDVWEVELESKHGVNTTVGLDANTKLIRYMKTSQVTPMGTMPIEAHSVDYKPIEGYLFSMKKNSSIKPLFELHEEITSFEVNIAIDESMFVFPTSREQVPADPNLQPPIVDPTPAPAQPAP